MPDSATKKKKLLEITEIFNLMDKTFSQMKIFSQEHDNVKAFADQLYSKLKEFLERYWKLEIDIDEFSFSHEGEIFLSQTQISKSLPFLLYKDGMKKIFFYKGLPQNEFFDFLNLLTRESNLPPEESDIVAAMWERDYSHIRYLAPDEYLESKIGTGMKIPDYQVNKDELYSGKIDLKSEDRQALDEALSRESSPGSPLIEEIGDIRLSEDENVKLESLLEKDRRSSEEEDYFSLLVEILYLEKNPDKLNLSLNAMLSHLIKYKNAGDFTSALNCLSEILDFRSSLHPEDPRFELIDRVFSPDRISVSISSGKSLVDQDRIQNYDDFLQYLQLTGRPAIPLLGYIFQKIPVPEIKKRAADILKKTGFEAPLDLIKIASDEKPELTQIIIHTLSSLQDEKAVNYLAHFVRSQNQDIRQSVIRALGTFRSRTAAKILTAFLSDQREDIRCLALDHLNDGNGFSIPAAVTDIMKNKHFHKKSRNEKFHFFLFLVRTGTEEAQRLMRGFLTLTGWRTPSSKVETGMACVSALSQTPAESSLSLLKEFSRKGHKKIQSACLQAYEKIKNENAG